MDIKTYQKEAVNTLSMTHKHQLDDLHMILGMVTEVGELADTFKKEMAYGKPIDWFNVKEEIGDIMWYIINFCSMNDMDLESILETNIRKLKARYPDKFSKEKALNRDLSKEREILESEV